MLIRAFLFACSLIALLHGLLIGLAKSGVKELDFLAQSQVPLHGVVLVSAFFGTLIALERAIFIKRFWTWGPPLLSVIAYGTLLAKDYFTAGMIWVVAAFWLTMVNLYAWWKVPSRSALLFILGAFGWWVGNSYWTIEGDSVSSMTWWYAFLLLTILGERLELNRVLGLPGRIRQALIVTMWFWSGGILAEQIHEPFGDVVQGLMVLLMAAWLFRYDMARHLICEACLSRFIGITLLVGYAWLVLFALLLIAHHWLPIPVDVLWHSFFLGFAFSAVFAHLPVMLPVLLGINVRYKRMLYVPVVMFHLALVMRFGAASLGWMTFYQFGAILSMLAIVLYFSVIMLVATRN